ncbi:MAG: hypothetical protein A2Y25_03035 [Candidatus Melainabacteria bacterium GWF2_37_15]|nr:MAG: hypothetical protein A2Y25_03035 [Candidatus Melainabacteria bacterium GWF2_37_15]
MTRYYPIMLDIIGKNCLVIGGGKVALRKITSLLFSSAKVNVISEELCEELKTYCHEGKICWIQKKFEPADIKNAVLVFAATDSTETNREIAKISKTKGIPVNVVDDPDLCDFIVPSIIEQGDLTITVSTNGKSPALAKKIREDLEKQFGPHYAKFLNILGNIREKASKEIPNITLRENLYKELVYSDIINLIEENKKDKALEKANKLLNEAFDEAKGHSRNQGK